MKSILLPIFLLLTIGLFASHNINENEISVLKKDFVFGNPGIMAVNAISFGPEGILFIGDSKAAVIYAIDLSADSEVDNSKVSLNEVDVKIADALGASSDEVEIIDMAVNKDNGNIYFAVRHSSDKPILLKLNGKNFKQVGLTNVSYSSISMNNPVGADSKDKRGRSLRQYAVSDLAYADGKVMVTGLSSDEFGSTFRIINFPFNETQIHSSLEIYHAAHGKYETHSPIKSFAPVMIDNKLSLVAGYTCTPLVVFPLSAMQSGKHTKGQTVAELGNRNTPLDIIEIERDGERFVLVANSHRALMKINVKDIESFEGSLSTPVKGSGTDGVDFINLPMVNVQQLADLNSSSILMLQRDGNGSLNLRTEGYNRL